MNKLPRTKLLYEEDIVQNTYNLVILITFIMLFVCFWSCAV